MERRSRAKIVFFLIVLTAFGVLAGLSVRANLADMRSLRYERTKGVVTISEVGERLESGRYAWRLEYTYTAAGQEYTGTRFDPGRPRGFRSESWGQSTTKTYPPGRKLTVYYDPADPAEATLRRATLARMLGGIWFLSGPLLVVLLLGLVMLVGGPPARFEVPAAGPPWTVRLPAAATFQAAGNVGAITYLAGFALVCLSGSVAQSDRDDGGEQAAAGIAIAAWVVYLAVLGGCVWRARAPALLVIDPAAGTLRYRPRWFRPAAVSIPLAAVRGVEVAERTVEWQGGSGHRYGVRITHPAAAIELPEYDERADAEALAAWVRGKVPVCPSFLVPP